MRSPAVRVSKSKSVIKKDEIYNLTTLMIEKKS